MSPIPLTSKRRPVKTTYSRNYRKPVLTNDIPDSKRRHLSVPSTPSSLSPSSSLALDSDASKEFKETPPSSPPSSPRPRKSHFTLVRRPTPTIRKKSRWSSAPPKLTQLSIDLGQSLRATCRLCGMSYHPSSPDDEALHKRFHAKSVGGIDFLLKPSSTPVWESPYAEGREKEYILRVDRKSSVSEKRKAREVLEVIDSELSAAEINEDVLWSEFVPKDGEGERERRAGGERFKMFLYILGKKCVGLCLAERIEKAYRVLENSDAESSPADSNPHFPIPNSKGGSVSISSTAHPSLLGISRIWTCSSHRRQGIAKRLLDIARETFIYGMKIDKPLVAFSQPTESGRLLARQWFGGGKKGGGMFWAVYIEET